MTKIRSVIILLSLIVIPLLRLTAGGVVDVRIDDVSGLAEPWPLLVGVPFAEGELRDPAAISLVGPAGEVPAQVDVVATWRDGSIRWAHVAFTGSPDEDYRVEFGNGVAPAATFDAAVTVAPGPAGGLVVDTGVARFEFTADGLLPDAAQFGAATVFSGSAGGAYFVDNHGRHAAVVGSAADVSTEVLRSGPGRAVIFRQGWYVTEEGDRIARARAWFHFAAGSAALKITHSLVLTEDTNDVWVRDYGLKFSTGRPPEEVTFAIGDVESGAVVSLGGAADAEVFMLQDVVPHFRNDAFRARVGRQVGGTEELVKDVSLVGDWADGRYGDFGLTVVVPWLAQQFPKEIVFGPEAVRVALWSSRSGRELDFRAATLVAEYWGEWADSLVERADSNVVPYINRYWEEERDPVGAEGMAQWPSNAQGVARTHDVWLIPHFDTTSDSIRQRALAAARPPLVLADPVRISTTGAMGWVMHPMDEDNFPQEEAFLDEYWRRLMGQFDAVPRTGLIAWGGAPLLSTGKLFRHGILADYALRRTVWGLYGRSGERKYYDYGAKFNRHIGDFWIAHWSAGDKFAGGFNSPGGYWEGHLPFIWGNQTTLSGDSSGHDVHNWLLDYYLTGDSYALYLHQLVGEAIRENWDAERVRSDERMERWEVFMPLQVLSSQYEREWDEEFGTLARDLSRRVIDFDNPNAINGMLSGGPLYKWERILHSLYNYYRATGDEDAREAILRALDYKYRFNFIRAPFHSTNHAAFLYALAYEWTGNPAYLRVVNSLIQQSMHGSRIPGSPETNAHPTMGVPAGLRLFVDADRPQLPFPLAEINQAPDQPEAFLFDKARGEAVVLSVFARFPNGADESTPLNVQLHLIGADGGRTAFGDAKIEVETVFKTPRCIIRTTPRMRYIEVTLPTGAPAGEYALTIPGVEYVRVLDVSTP